MRPSDGKQVNVEGIGLCEVLPGNDPSLVTLKLPGGATLKIGEQALRERMGSRTDDETADTARGERHAQEGQ